MRNTMNDRYMTNGKTVVACSIKDVAPFSAQGFTVCDKSEYDKRDVVESEPDVQDSIASFVDDRSLPDLTAMGIATPQDFVDADQDGVIKGVKFITAKAYDQIRLKILSADKGE